MTPDPVSPWQTLLYDGLWRKNPVLVQMLGLCPTLAVSNTVANALGLGLATLVVLVCSNVAVSAFRRFIPRDIRIPIYVLLIASLVTLVQLIMQAIALPLYNSLGIFIALIVTNCVVIGRAESYASQQPIHYAAFDGLMMGLGFLWVLLLLGAARELIGTGQLFQGMGLLIPGWTLTLQPLDQGLLIAMLPPGGFIALGCCIAAKNKWFS